MPDVDLRFSGKRTLKHLGSQVDAKIEDFRTTLLKLHKAFVDEASVVTEITALQILDDVGVLSANVGIMSAHVGVISASMGTISADVGRISNQLDRMATQLKWVSGHAFDAGT